MTEGENLKPSMKRSIKYAVIKFGWWMSTTTPACVIFFDYGWTIKGIATLFLGASAFMFGTEVIEQVEKGNIKW